MALDDDHRLERLSSLVDFPGQLHLHSRGKRHLRARAGHAESLQSASAYAFRREQFKGVWAGPLGGSRCTKRGRREQMPTAEIEVTSLAGRQTL
ncbi:MAG: hypothetical protein ACXW3Y_06745, partial [Rhodoplanes sp.]